jgi:acyl-CoA synthetase (AMP-forming)/AMP-acid ligase II
MSNSYSQALERAARIWPSRPAVWDGPRCWTFAELQVEVGRLARWLVERAGVRPGDRVVDMRPNSQPLILSDFAVATADAVRVALNPAHSADELRRQVEILGPRVLLVADELIDRLGGQWLADRGVMVVDDRTLAAIVAGADPVAPPASGDPHPLVADESVLAIRFTGGTTGEPKAVLRTVSQQMWVAASVLADLWSFSESDVLLHTQPLAVGAHAFVLPAVLRGAAQVLMPTTRLDAGATFELVQQRAVTVIKCVPTVLGRFVDHLAAARPPQGLRAVLYGASPASQPLITSALAAFGPSVSFGQTYGQTEVPATITRLTAADHERIRAGATELTSSVGRPYSFTDVMICDPGGAPVRPGSDGEVWVNSPLIAQWRWTGSAVTRVHEPGRSHATGDIGHLDADGYLYLTGRAKDLLITGGYNVYPAEIEKVLLTHPAVKDACVVGISDDTWGDMICAAVTLNTGADGADAAALIEHCRAHSASYRVPKRIEIVPTLPLTSAGKVSRADTKRLYFAQPD